MKRILYYINSLASIGLQREVIGLEPLQKLKGYEVKVATYHNIPQTNNCDRKKGRINLISNKDNKLQELKTESRRFDFWTTILKERKASIIELDMRDSTPSIADKLLSNLINQQLSKENNHD
ncbi:MAG: hypothetical protein J6P55_04460 [Bacteroidaceae bacterium]|nr:hypothetical protein [Bacteroidaceae bacterium]